MRTVSRHIASLQPLMMMIGALQPSTQRWRSLDAGVRTQREVERHAVEGRLLRKFRGCLVGGRAHGAKPALRRDRQMIVQ